MLRPNDPDYVSDRVYTNADMNLWDALFGIVFIVIFLAPLATAAFGPIN
jgi:uncharacterized membrane protein